MRFVPHGDAGEVAEELDGRASSPVSSRCGQPVWWAFHAYLAIHSSELGRGWVAMRCDDPDPDEGDAAPMIALYFLQ